jgi:predicted RNA-binding Zn ribbon-like protein
MSSLQTTPAGLASRGGATGDAPPRRLRGMSASEPVGSRSKQLAAEPEAGAGALCLDLVATNHESGNHGSDLLGDPKQLDSWLRGAGLPVPAGGLTDADVATARELRAAVEAVARALVAVADVPPADIRRINTFARHPTPVFLLRPSGRDRIVVEEVEIHGSLSVVARDAIYVFADSDPARLRECARPGCARLYYDRSPSGRRRWCAMKGCGEIVASATYRQRRAAKVST